MLRQKCRHGPTSFVRTRWDRAPSAAPSRRPPRPNPPVAMPTATRREAPATPPSKRLLASPQDKNQTLSTTEQGRCLAKVDVHCSRLSRESVIRCERNPTLREC